MVLEEYKEIVGFSAMVITMGHMLSGTFICKDIYKKSTSKGVDPKPFLGTIGLCILMLRYALMLGDINMIRVNCFGLATNIFYIIMYYYFAPNTQEAVLKDRLSIFVITIIAIMLLVYAQIGHLIEHPTNVEYRFGVAVTILLFLLIATPLVHLADIIKTKNTEILPFPLILMGTLVSSNWLLYGFIIENTFIIFQNAVGLVLNIAQLSLFVIFPSKKSHKRLLNKEKKKD